MKRRLIIFGILVLVSCTAKNEGVTMSLVEYNQIQSDIEALQEEVQKHNNERVLYYTKGEAMEAVLMEENALDLKKTELYELLEKRNICDGKFDSSIEEADGVYSRDVTGLYEYDDGLIVLYANGKCLYGTYVNGVLTFTTSEYEMNDGVLTIGDTYVFKPTEIRKKY